MNEKTMTYLVFVALIALVLSVGVANFDRSVTKDKINTCRELEDDGIKDEAYFECLEQNNLDTWDMSHENLLLTINYWIVTIGLLILLFLLLNVPYMLWNISKM